MTKNAMAVAVAVFVGGFILGVVVTGRPEPKAATSLVGFLILVLLVLGTVGAGVALAPGWLKRRKRRAQLEDAAQLAQIYSALSGKRPQSPAARRPAQQPSVYIVGGGRPEPRTVDDAARWLEVGQ